MKPESRDYTLASKIKNALDSDQNCIVKIRCFNQEEILMSKRILPERLVDRVYFTYREFYLHASH